MSIRAQRFATKTRTWVLIAGLTALLIGIGALIGGVWHHVFVVLAIAMNIGLPATPRRCRPKRTGSTGGPGSAPRGDTHIQRGRPDPARRLFGSAN